MERDKPHPSRRGGSLGLYNHILALEIIELY